MSCKNALLLTHHFLLFTFLTPDSSLLTHDLLVLSPQSYFLKSSQKEAD